MYSFVALTTGLGRRQVCVAMTIECSCGYSCGTLAAFERHVARGLPGEHRALDPAVAPDVTDDDKNALLDASRRLLTACEVGDLDTAQAALDAGAQADGPERISTGRRVAQPLMLAAENGHREVVEMLLAQRASLLLGDGQRDGTIRIAARNGHLAIASLLLTHVHNHSVFVRKRSVNTIGSRREVAAGELTKGQVADLLGALGDFGDDLPASCMAMLVGDGHLESTEPTGLSGLANRLAGQPSKWLAGHLAVAQQRAADRRQRTARIFEQVELCMALGAHPRWKPTKHLLFPLPFRRAAMTVLLCANRLSADADAAADDDERADLGSLPKEVLLLLVGELAESTFWRY